MKLNSAGNLKGKVMSKILIKITKTCEVDKINIKVVTNAQFNKLCNRLYRENTIVQGGTTYLHVDGNCPKDIMFAFISQFY